MRLREHPGILPGRSDVRFCKPDALSIEEGYNVRDLTTPEALQELDELEELVLEHGVRTPLLVRFASDEIWIVEGHRRITVVNRLIAKFKESNGEFGRNIEAVPIIAERDGTTPLDRDFGLVHSNSGVKLKALEFANLIYRTITQRGISEGDAAKGFGVSLPVLKNHLAIRAMPEPVKQHVREGNISATLARNLAKSDLPPEEQDKLIKDNLDQNRRIRGAGKGSTKVTQKTLKRDAKPKTDKLPVPPRAPRQSETEAREPARSVALEPGLAELPAENLPDNFIAAAEGGAMDILRKIEREATRALDEGNTIQLQIALKYCRDVARDVLNIGGEG